jgi:hypothetical protein
MGLPERMANPASATPLLLMAMILGHKIAPCPRHTFCSSKTMIMPNKKLEIAMRITREIDSDLHAESSSQRNKRKGAKKGPAQHYANDRQDPGA